MITTAIPRNETLTHLSTTAPRLGHAPCHTVAMPPSPQTAEFVAARLYTGPMYKKYQCVLRAMGSAQANDADGAVLEVSKCMHD